MARDLKPGNAARRERRAAAKKALIDEARLGKTIAEIATAVRRKLKPSEEPLRRRKKPVQTETQGVTASDCSGRLRSHWAFLIERVSQTEARSYSGVRKIVDNLHFNVPGSVLFDPDPGMTFEDLCFTDRGKMGQLRRNYFSADEWQKAVDKVKSREGKPHTSVAIRLTAAGKDSRSQGFCMQSLILSITKDCYTIDIFYRSTEVTQKFCADLLFFNRIIPEFLLAPLGLTRGDIQTVRFHFANAYISSVFLPVALRFAERGAVGYLEAFRESDPRFYRTSCMVAARYMRTVNVYNYMTQKKQYLAMHIPEMDDERRRLKPYLKEHIERISAEQGDHMFAEEEDE